ncbi:unnamed protein product [Allacma fusca]|nr:unnamed protein product [Allacma fusca]
MDVDSASAPRVLIKKIKTDTPARELMYKETTSKERETCTELFGEVVQALQLEHPIKIRQEIYVIDSTYLDIQKNISRDVTSFIIQRGEDGRILTGQSGKKVNDFCSSCPIPDLSHPNISILSLPVAIKCGEDDKCVADLRIEARFLEIDPGESFTIGSFPTVTLLITVTNSQEKAIGPEVTISFSRRSLKYVPKTCKSIPMELFSSYKCSLGLFLEQDGAASVSMEFDMSDLVAGRQELEKEYIFHIEATTASEMLQPAAIDLVLPFVASVDTHLYASTKVMKFNEKTLQPYQILSHLYEVRLKGPSPLSSLRLSFKVPVNLTRTLDSLEVVQVLHAKAEIDGVDVQCQATNVHESKDKDIRSERNTNQMEPRVIRKKHMIFERAIYFECTSRFVDCMEIICMFPEFQRRSRGSVTIGLRVSSNTVRNMFEEEGADVLVIASQGVVTTPIASLDIQMYNDLPDTDESSTVIVLEKAAKVSKWIIVGSIVMGILLLFLICLLYSLISLGCLRTRQVETAEDDDEFMEIGKLDEDLFNSERNIPKHIRLKPILEPISEEFDEHSS